MESKPQSPPFQLFVCWAALLLWSALAIPSWVVAIGCYLLALAIVNLVAIWFPAWLTFGGVSLRQRRFIWLLLWLVPGVFAARVIAGMKPATEIAAIRENLADRWALERTPSIFPALLVAYEPQRFTIYAPGAKQVSVRWTPDSPELTAIDLGHGVHLLDFDPRSDESLSKLSGDSISCTLTTDGVNHQRMLNFVHPQPHPRRLRSIPTAGIAAAVSEETDEVILVRRDGSAERIAVGDGPTDCAFYDEGHKLVVAHRNTPELWLLEVASKEVLSRLTSRLFQTRLAVSADRSRLAVAIDDMRPGLRIFSLPEPAEVAFIPLDFAPDQLEFGATSQQLIVTDRRGRAIHRFVEQDQRWTSDRPPLRFPRPITTLGQSATLGHLALATTASYLTAGQPQANHFLENTIHTLDVDRWEIVATQLTDRRGLAQDSPGSTEHGISPLAFAVIDGRLHAAFAGSNEVAEVSSSGISTGYLALDDFPLFAPQGLADLGDGVFCVSSPVEGNLGLFNREGLLQKLIALADSENDLQMSAPATLARRRGERTFFEGTRAGIACQSCHLESATDFSLHDIGQGKPVDVLSVRGVIGTSPYLRDASHWRLRELHDVAVTGYRDHQRSVNWDRAAALDAYLNSLPPAPHSRLREKYDVARMQRGVSAFFAADCAVCHTPPAFTNLGQQPAASLFPDHYSPGGPAAGLDAFLDTPTLRGIVLTAPYLHDGRARTLEAVLGEHNRGQRHGNTRRLSSPELDDLLYFLERL